MSEKKSYWEGENKKMMIFFVLVIFIFGILIGLILGTFWGQNLLPIVENIICEFHKPSDFCL